MGSIWELDFYSRPILDENQKKIWEVVICESPLETRTKIDSLFRFAKYCPSTEVNSGGYGRRCKKQLAMQEKHREESAFSAAK
jgi:hypothetical protein